MADYLIPMWGSALNGDKRSIFFAGLCMLLHCGYSVAWQLRVAAWLSTQAQLELWAV